VTLSGDLGVPDTGREALEWAILGALAQDGTEIALPAVTHRPGQAGPIPGAWIKYRQRSNHP
jgi:hypothetical protein